MRTDLKRLIEKNSAELARHGVAYARAAYGQCVLYNRLAENLNQRGTSCQQWEYGNAQGLLIRRADMAAIAIAGTNDTADAIDDADVGSITIGEHCEATGLTTSAPLATRVHIGFLTHATLVLRGLQSFNLSSCDDVMIFGHSLGGAAASILPMLWPELKAHVVTYGAPPYLKRSSPEPAQRITRVVHYFDPVPCYPALTYRHPKSTTIYIRRPGSFRTRRPWHAHLARWAFVLAALGRKVTGLPLLPKGVFDCHLMDAYARGLGVEP